LINVGDEFISIDDLETSIRLAYAFMCGCECAIIQCKADDASLVEAMNLEDPPGGFATRSIIDAANLFGTNGLRVRSYALNRGVFSLEIDDWGPDAVNPGLQAITVASQVLSRAHRIQISIGDSATLAADVETAQVQKNLPVWLMARTLFTEMPPSTFLPTNAAIRTAVESSTQAAQAVTWLALNDALHVFEDIADASDDRRLLRRMWSQFQGRLALASYALQISEEVVGPGDERTIAAKLALKKASLETSKPPKEIVQKFLISLGKNVEKFWHDLGPVPVLPTVDKTPLE